MALVPTTCQSLVSAVRFQTNTENNQIVTDGEIIGWLNEGLCQLDMVLISKFDDYKIAQVLIPWDATNGVVPLPADFLKLRGLDIQFNASDPDGYVKVNKFNFQKRNRRPYGFTGPVGYGPYGVEYRLVAQGILIEPVALANQWPYRVWYTPDYIPLVNPGDTLQPYMDSQEWSSIGIKHACVQVLAKQDLDPSTFISQKAELVELITRLSAPNRDAGEPASVCDTRSDYGYGGWGGFGF